MKGNWKEIWLFERCAIFSKHMRALTLGFSQRLPDSGFHLGLETFFHSKDSCLTFSEVPPKQHICDRNRYWESFQSYLFWVSAKTWSFQTWTKSSFSFFAQRKAEMCKNVKMKTHTHSASIYSGACVGWSAYKWYLSLLLWVTLYNTYLC